MPVGDCCILSEAAGGDVDNSATLEQYQWDTVEHVDAATFSVFSDLGIQCLEARPYLFGYNTSHTGTGSNRSELRSFLEINLVPQTYGGTSDYIRRSGDFAAASSGMTILEVAQDQVVSVGHFRSDSNTGGATCTRNGGETAFWAVALDDSWSYLRLQDTTSQAVAASAAVTPPFLIRDLNWTPLELRISDRKDTGYTHSTTVSPAEITLAGNRQYLICYSVEFQNTSTSARRNGIVRAVAGGTFVVPGSVSTAYARGSNTTQRPIASGAFIYDAQSADVSFELQAAVDCESSGATLNVLNVAITILDLSEAGEFIGVKPDTSFTKNAAVGTFDPIEYASEHITGAGSNYSWDGANPSRISTTQAGRHLVWSCFFSERTGVNTTRKRPRVSFRYNDGAGDVALGYGLGDEFNRGDQSSTSTWLAAGFGAGLFDLATPQHIEVSGNDAATTAAADHEWEQAYCATFALEIASLAAPAGITVALEPAVFELGAVDGRLDRAAPLDVASTELAAIEMQVVRAAPLEAAPVELVAIDMTVLVEIVVPMEPATFEVVAAPFAGVDAPTLLPIFVPMEPAVFTLFNRIDPQLLVGWPLEPASAELVAIDHQVRIEVVVELAPAAAELVAVDHVVSIGVDADLEAAAFELVAVDHNVSIGGVASLDPAAFELVAVDHAVLVDQVVPLGAAAFEFVAIEMLPVVGVAAELDPASFELVAVDHTLDLPVGVSLPAAAFELRATAITPQLAGVASPAAEVVLLAATLEMELPLQLGAAHVQRLGTTISTSGPTLSFEGAATLRLRASREIEVPLNAP